jgi:hypothetical protein
LKTYTQLRNLVDNPQYLNQRQNALNGLSDDMLDAPIVDTIKGLNDLPCCFTLQSCWGHFEHKGLEVPNNLEQLTLNGAHEKVTYRLAYIALCIQNTAEGRELLQRLNHMPSIDPDNIQFCCAEWFWNRQVNSYVLQVEPDLWKDEDTAILDLEEARYICRLRDGLFIRFTGLLNENAKGKSGLSYRRRQVLPT